METQIYEGRIVMMFPSCAATRRCLWEVHSQTRALSHTSINA